LPLRGGAPWIASPSHRSTTFARDAAACSAARSSLRSPSPGLSRRWQQRRHRGQRYVFASASTTIIAPNHRSLHVLGWSGVAGSIGALEDLFVPFDPLPDHLSHSISVDMWGTNMRRRSSRRKRRAQWEILGKAMLTMWACVAGIQHLHLPVLLQRYLHRQTQQRGVERHLSGVHTNTSADTCLNTTFTFNSAFPFPSVLLLLSPFLCLLLSHTPSNPNYVYQPAHATYMQSSLSQEKPKTCFWSQDVAISHTLSHYLQNQVPGCSDCTKSLCFEHIKKVFFLH